MSAQPTRAPRRDPLAPLPRTMIDAAGPVVRGGVGALFVAFSSYATVFLFASDVQPILGDRMTLGAWPDRYWAGVLLALAFFLGEVFSSERYPRLYRAILVPDTIYTARQLYLGLHAGLRVLVTDQASLLLVLALIAGGVLLVAYGAGFSLRLWFAAIVLSGGVAYLTFLLADLATAQIMLAGLLALYIGYIVARFGEALLFGRRRITAKGG